MLNKRSFAMVAQVSKEAIRALKVELRLIRGGEIGAKIMNRLQNENPEYALIGNGFLEVFEERFGKEARVMVRDTIAICYRVLELSERHPDKKRIVQQALLADPKLEGDSEAIKKAQKEVEDLVKKLMLH
ncbi:MAG: hypothetical protein A2494_04125 [Candidatus Lloydbacteria bacterium RIFOXYC12_FULL_46_25]|uniref:Uncharacterized protein n=1 Tax=Candidatus Lloydbacteria bacterium RIFOXYC12_FULL_46_25 TaxID=1798670 RepID=A0A1G2E5X9_9BACT|nr:MAG: hypothetical protein A2494_04125 [Candidatus Lloydbacteria bacterium RIFOXYC12_FULL_46_25]